MNGPGRSNWRAFRSRTRGGVGLPSASSERTGTTPQPTGPPHAVAISLSQDARRRCSGPGEHGLLDLVNPLPDPSKERDLPQL